MLPMIEKCKGGGICHVVHRYAKVNNKHVRDYDSNTKSLYLMYWDVSNLYGWVMSSIYYLLVLGGKRKSLNSNSDKGYIFEVNINCPNRLQKIQSDFPFLPE